MNTLPETLQRTLIDHHNSINYNPVDRVTRAHIATPEGEEICYLQMKSDPPSESFLDFVENTFIPKTPFSIKPFILREGCTWESMYATMAMRAFDHACVPEPKVIRWIKNPRKDGSVDEERFYDSDFAPRKSLRERVAEYRFKLLMERIAFEEAYDSEDFDW